MEWVGRVLGGCQIVEKIGEGRMAVVYRAYQPHLERWVAVKILRATEADDREEFLQRFRQEARAIAALRHPNILTVYDYGEAHGTAYIVMEYVPGGSLKARLTGQPIPWPEVARWVIPVGQALAYAHAQGIVHRDVKPANILLARPDWPLLADFGLAKILGRTGITRPGVSVGTPAYLSPEQVMGEAVDHRTDIYSLGVVLYELLTGQLPFQAPTPAEAMFRRLREPPIPPRQLCPSLSPALEAVLLRALARNPADRYPAMQAMVDDLLRVGPGPGITPPVSPTPGDRGTTLRLERLRAVAGPRLCVVETGAMIPIPPGPEIVLGRSSPTSPFRPDIDLEPYGASMAGISRRHARLLHRPEGWFLEDLQSTNGTFLNEVRLSPGQPVRLNSGDLIRLGQLTLLFYSQ